MSDFKATMKTNNVTPEVRAKILAQIYAAILSWPDPREKKDTAASNFGEEIAAGLEEGSDPSAQSSITGSDVQDRQEP